MTSNICILYLYEEKFFYIVGQDVKISNDKKCITKLTSHWQNGSYGMNQINSNTQGIHEWHLKTRKMVSNTFMFGISNLIRPNRAFYLYVYGSAAQNCLIVKQFMQRING